MAFVEEAQEAESQVNARDDFPEEENEEKNDQTLQHDQLAPTPIQENGIQEGGPGATDPPPPHPDRDCENGFTGNDYPAKFWCVFPQ